MLLATSFCTLSCDLVGEWLDLVYTELPGLNPKQLQGSDQKAQPCGASRQNCLLGVVPAGQVTWRAPCCPSWIKLGQEVSRSLLSYILTAADHLSTRQLHLSSRVKTLSLKQPAEVYLASSRGAAHELWPSNKAEGQALAQVRTGHCWPRHLSSSPDCSLLHQPHL